MSTTGGLLQAAIGTQPIGRETLIGRETRWNYYRPGLSPQTLAHIVQALFDMISSLSRQIDQQNLRIQSFSNIGHQILSELKSRKSASPPPKTYSQIVTSFAKDTVKKFGETALNAIFSPLTGSWNLVTLNIPSALQDGAMTAITYFALPSLADRMHIPYLGDGLRSTRDYLFEIPKAIIGTIVGSGAEEAKNLATETGKKLITSSKEEARRLLTPALPAFFQSSSPQVTPLTTSTIAAQGLEGATNSFTSPENGSDFLSLATLIAGAALVYFGYSKVTAYLNQLSEAEKTSP